MGKYIIERLVKIPVEVDVASEFRYRDPLVDENTLFIAISQSGETLDTLAALREAKKKGARVLSVVNVVGKLCRQRIGRRVLYMGGTGDSSSLHQGVHYPAHVHVYAGVVYGSGKRRCHKRLL